MTPPPLILPFRWPHRRRSLSRSRRRRSGQMRSTKPPRRTRWNSLLLSSRQLWLVCTLYSFIPTTHLLFSLLLIAYSFIPPTPSLSFAEGIFLSRFCLSLQIEFYPPPQHQNNAMFGADPSRDRAGGQLPGMALVTMPEEAVDGAVARMVGGGGISEFFYQPPTAPLGRTWKYQWLSKVELHSGWKRLVPTFTNKCSSHLPPSHLRLQRHTFMQLNGVLTWTSHSGGGVSIIWEQWSDKLRRLHDSMGAYCP